MATATKSNEKKAVAEKPEKVYPRLPISARVSAGSAGQKFQHGIGVLATGDPETKEPRISIGNVWFPEDAATQERYPAFMRSTTILSLDEAKAFQADLAQAIANATEGKLHISEKPAKAKKGDPQVAAQVRQEVIDAFVAMGMSPEAAAAAYETAQARKQPATDRKVEVI